MTEAVKIINILLIYDATSSAAYLQAHILARNKSNNYIQQQRLTMYKKTQFHSESMILNLATINED